MSDPISDFQEGQWWVKELDNMVKQGTPDQKRAVAVVHNLLRSILADTIIVPCDMDASGTAMSIEGALSCLLTVFDGSEESEGEDGLVAVTDLALWHEGRDALTTLVETHNLALVSASLNPGNVSHE